MDKFSKLKKDLRDISIFDRVRAFIFKSPVSIGNTCELYNQWLRDFLDSGADPIKTDRYTMTLLSDDGRTVKIWVGNYPYSYGNRDDASPFDAHWLIYPSWDLVLRLRKLQLMDKEQVINEYRDRMLLK